MNGGSVMTVRTVRNFVGGNFVEAGEADCYDKVNPVDGCMAALVHQADAAVVDRAVRAARAALDGQWGRVPLTAAVVEARIAGLGSVSVRGTP